MGLFRISSLAMGTWAMLLFVFYVSLGAAAGDDNDLDRKSLCGDVSSIELRNNVTRDLYSIERELKILSLENELVDDNEELDQFPLILHTFLSSNYAEAESSLQSLIPFVSEYSTNGSTNSEDYIPEAMVDFCKRTVMLSERALVLIRQLIRCSRDVNSTSYPQKPFPDSSSNSPGKGTPKCSVDGTKCQYSKCAKGNKLPVCAVGFATGVTGGANGRYYVVTRSDDSNPKNPAPGTLRHAVDFGGKSKGGVWIVFKNSMEIKLKEKLWINSHTTIDGRGANITIWHRGLALARVENIILHNFEIVSTGQSDTVHVFDGTHRVWIDHLTSRDAYLGLVTVLQGSTDITISNCFLSNHNFNMLLGASDQDTVDQILRVTVYRNWFESSNQRMPHCRWGYCHVVNNYYRDWNYYAIGGRVHAKILSELNVFEPGKRLEVTPWHDLFTSDLTPTIESSQDLLLKGATFHQFLAYGTLSSPESEYPSYRLPTRPANTSTGLVINCSGVLFGEKRKRCISTP
ncbi:probable pectate lyase P18 [Papaver somniferum]|uniref:probable pectate lyase P18 n=1 Tax=Papaver somniferum TaxID=3469 RepID=UPI000E705059|nr:probable pectate lyase P18 [Papaver somniferum]